MRIPKFEPDPERPNEPPEWKRAREIHEAYQKQFGEQPPIFGQPNDDLLDRMVQAMKTGRKIREQLPPGCDA